MRKRNTENSRARFLYVERKAPFDDILLGNDIKKHLEGCHTAVMMCATIGSELTSLSYKSDFDMARAVVLDSFASVAVEQVCQKVDEILAEKYSGKYMTFRFSPGYGDYPIEMQKEYLRILDAPRKIGLTTGDSCLLVPSKSVTAVLGIQTIRLNEENEGVQLQYERQMSLQKKWGTLWCLRIFQTLVNISTKEFYSA